MSILMHQTTMKGRMIFRGNTLGISNTSGQCCRQWALISLDSTQSAGSGYPSSNSTTLPGAPFGTTLDWTKDGSFCQIDIASTETVHYAALIWGMVNPPVSADTPITFTTPTTTTIVNPTALYSLQSSDSANTYHTRAKDITDIVKNGGSGIYSVSAVPAPTNPSSNVGTGWVLAVIFSDNTQPVRNMSVFSESAINAPSSLVTSVSGFVAPSVSPINALAYVSAQWGDAGFGTESFQVNGMNLSGTKNPVSNFFQSQVVDENGNYYNASMNSFNCTVGNPGSVNPFSRMDYDITTVNATGAIAPNSTTAQIIVPFDTRDTVTINALGLQLDALLATIDTIKSVDKNFAGGGSTLTYTISFTNSGNTTAQSIFFIDTIPSNSTFVADSVVVNGTSLPGTNPNPPSSVPISNLGPSSTSTVTFKVLVNTTIPIPSTIYNSARLDYNTLGSTTTTPSTSLSNIVATTINAQATINLSKSASPSAVKLGETITYTLVMTNTGNATANNVFLSDTLPLGTTLAFGSLNPNPPSSISVGSISPGSTSTVTFNVITTTLPASGTIPNIGSVNFTFTQDPSVPNGASGNVNSNTVITHINEAILSSSKFVSRASASLGDTLTYTIAITNSGNTTANNLVFIDTIPIGTTFVLGSLKQNGTTIPSSPNPPGTALNSIAPGGISTITFDVLAYTIPSVNPILNNSTTNFNYIFDPSTVPNALVSSNTNSNIVSTLFGFATLNNSIKYVDKQYAKCGETITYTIIIPNSGNVTANDIFLVDTIPNSTALVPNSVIINGIIQTGYNPSTGITIPNIGPRANATINFKVVVQC